MPTVTTARSFNAVDEAQQQTLAIMIDSMVRAGHTEDEITLAVEETIELDAGAPAPATRPTLRARLRSLLAR
jgi:hypothetical protein